MLEARLMLMFWLDEVLWSAGRDAVSLAEAVLTEAGGVRTGGPSRAQERARRRLEAAAGQVPERGGSALGSSRMGLWEVLWTKSTYAIPAARAMRPGQLVSAVIGLNCLTMKKRMLGTLLAAYGPDAGPGGTFSITPLSFALPEQTAEWAQWLRERLAAKAARAAEAAGELRNGPRRQGQDQDPVHGDEGGFWILKTGQDAGKGLSLLSAEQALQYATAQLAKPQLPQAPEGQEEPLTHRLGSGSGPGGGGASGGGSGGSAGGAAKRFALQVAQLYVGRPLLVGGRKCHLRCWLLVTAHSPLRAYLHRRGLVLFSSELYDPAATAAAVAASASSPSAGATPLTGGAAGVGAATAPPSSPAPAPLPASHVTNYAQNNNTLVWSLGQLAEHLGDQAWGAVWAALRAACARSLAAARSSLAEANAWLRPAVQEYGFQLLGADFLLDERLRPWLLEFNSSPSIMVQHTDGTTRRLIFEQKYGMMRDIWEMVRWRVYRQEEEGGGPMAAAAGRRRRQPEGPAAAARAEAAAAGEFEALMPYMP
ncbi:hypothetical protein GPECTOR_40g526 [Gonium pectorale]|uniref:Tubulin--tyrosine ligase-like protein 5 n=1 Tax=Gonium pectorale TaxID=33097 RepID=A0A150GAC6_GONPE|nr:hypothetical protein GPECTOR_40g526 [Gonium pectorale]|eukprot:KXZ46792.1 hypothetical protein GPECTOR_40g526 [Gonium pectorale]